MAGAVLSLRPALTPAPSEPAAQAKRIRTKIVFAVERFADIVTEMGPLNRAHDKELWPNREWGPLSLAVPEYLGLEIQNRLLVLTARTGTINPQTEKGRLIGYSLDIVESGSRHYSKTSHVQNDAIFLHADYRVGKGLSLRKQPGFRFLQFRERELDKRQIERRRIDAKLWKDFGPILKLLGYGPEAVIYSRIVPKNAQEDD